MTSISILIPTYNGICKKLVSDLQQQAAVMEIEYEVIVADDGSTDQNTILENRGINDIPNCRYLECPENRGRSAIRNYLARQARLQWVLFIDSDMTVRSSDFIRRYAECANHDVVYGGVSIGGDAEALRGNLRYRYEKKEEALHTATMRRKSPYKDFHTANFMIRRELILDCPFDESIRRYGYEDVLLGKQLKQKGIQIYHIDNPLSFEVFEDNSEFVSKTEEGLRTLFTFRDKLKDYSRLIEFTGRHSRLVPAIRMTHKILGPLERRMLTSRFPYPTIFKLYKTGYYLSLSDNARNKIANSE